MSKEIKDQGNVHDSSNPDYRAAYAPMIRIPLEPAYRPHKIQHPDIVDHHCLWIHGLTNYLDSDRSLLQQLEDSGQVDPSINIALSIPVDDNLLQHLHQRIYDIDTALLQAAKDILATYLNPNVPENVKAHLSEIVGDALLQTATKEHAKHQEVGDITTIRIVNQLNNRGQVIHSAQFEDEAYLFSADLTDDNLFLPAGIFISPPPNDLVH